MNMRRLGICAAVLATACGGTAHIDETSSALTLPNGVTEYWWSQGQPAVNLIPDSDGICGLTAVIGAFRGDGEHVQVQDVNGVWQLSGSSGQTGVMAQARCVQFNVFQYSTASYSLGDWWSSDPPFDNSHQVYWYNMWNNHAACWVNGFGGFWNYIVSEPLRPGGVAVAQNNIGPSGGPPTVEQLALSATRQASANYGPQPMFGAAACVDFPNAQATQINGRVGLAANRDQNTARAPTGVNILPSWNSLGGICFLGNVGGDFAMPTDGVGIVIDGHGWQTLSVSALDYATGNGKTPVAGTHCIAYQQG
jgi:hypothetical protein